MLMQMVIVVLDEFVCLEQCSAACTDNMAGGHQHKWHPIKSTQGKDLLKGRTCQNPRPRAEVATVPHSEAMCVSSSSGTNCTIGRAKYG